MPCLSRRYSVHGDLGKSSGKISVVSLKVRCATDDDCDIDAICDERNNCVKVGIFRVFNPIFSFCVDS